jgi:hypothetical protein
VVRRYTVLYVFAAAVTLVGCAPWQSGHRHHDRRHTTTTTSATSSTVSTSTTSTTTRPATPSGSTTVTAPKPAADTQAVSSLAAWNVPAADVAISPRSADWANRYWNYADSFDHNWTVEFGLGVAGNDFSVAEYSTADATTTARVFQRPVDAWNGNFDVPNGSTIPWNPSWTPSAGSDAYMIIHDPGTGEEWDIWALSMPIYQAGTVSQIECTLDVTDAVAGFQADTDLCAAGLNIITGPDGKPADTRSYRGNFPGAGGGGLQNSAGLTTPEEVASGVIKHALKFTVGPELSMTGPVCPADVSTPDDPRVGTTCGTAVAPAGQFENRATNSDPAALQDMVPEGTRLIINDTDAQIDQWLDQRGYTGTLRQTARTFAIALRDYGLIQTDTSKGPAAIPVAGGSNPATAAEWRSLGITDDGTTLLDGLVTASNIEVLEPATNHCGDGSTSHIFCWASSTGY